MTLINLSHRVREGILGRWPLEKKILVVEDDQSIRDSIQEILEYEGYSVLSAENGQRALDILREITELPHLIFLDLMMPVKDGFEFREEQKRDPMLQEIPVVVMSADGHVAEKKARIEAKEYLRKPADLEDILRVLQKYAPAGPH